MIDILIQCPLFTGISKKQIQELLDCLSVNTKTFHSGEYVKRAKDTTNQVGVVLNGLVYAIEEDLYGNRNIVAEMGQTEIFGEGLSSYYSNEMPVSLVATDDTEVLFIEMRKITELCHCDCDMHQQVMNNMAFIIAKNNIILAQNIIKKTKNSIRNKILSYLSSYALQEKSEVLEIPFNHQQLADYLCVDFKGLLRELNEMQKEEIIKIIKNKFILLR